MAGVACNVWPGRTYFIGDEIGSITKRHPSSMVISIGIMTRGTDDDRRGGHLVPIGSYHIPVMAGQDITHLGGMTG